MTPSQESDSGPHLDRLRAWAESRGLVVDTYTGTQREPGNGVSLRRASDGRWDGRHIIGRESQDNVDTAAMYLINALELLGVEI